MFIDASEGACRLILQPYHDQLCAVPHAAWNTFRRIDPYLRMPLERYKRSHATAIWAYEMAAIDHLFEGVEGVRSIEEFETTTLDIRGRLAVRFKRVKASGRSSNYPTSRARRFNNDPDQGELFTDVWARSIRLDVGYQMDEDGENIEHVSVIRRTGDRVAWRYPLRPPAAPIILPFVRVMPSARKPRIVGRGDGGTNRAAQTEE